MLVSSISFLAYILSSYQIESLLASRLYKIKENEPGQAKSNLIIPSRCNSIKVLLVDLVPEKLLCRCCKSKSRQEIALEKAREALNAEMNMLDIVKSMRYFKLALEHLVSKEVESELKDRSENVYIDVCSV